MGDILRKLAQKLLWASYLPRCLPQENNGLSYLYRCLNWPTLPKESTEKRILGNVVSGFIAPQRRELRRHVGSARLATGNPDGLVNSIGNSGLWYRDSWVSVSDWNHRTSKNSRAARWPSCGGEIDKYARRERMKQMCLERWEIM